MTILRYLFPALLTGCASIPDITQISSDTFIVSRQSDPVFHNPESPKSEAVRAADRHCRTENKRVRFLSVKETIPPFTAENLPSAEIEFKCVDADASGSPYHH